MDVLTVVFFSLLSAWSTGALVAYNIRQTTDRLPRRREPVLYTKYLLPPPGQNFELYTRAKQVMDELVMDKCKAQSETQRANRLLEESDATLVVYQAKMERLEIENARLMGEIARLNTKIEAAKKIVQSFTHPGMRLFHESSEPGQRVVQAI